MLTGPVVLVAFLGGLLPTLLWLVFWQLEDRCEPEPKKLILFCFVGGMIVVPFVIPFQSFAQAHTSGALMLFFWAAIEELFKFGAAWVIALRNKAVDEPIDAIIYMLTVALGFAALENTLFLLDPLAHGNALAGIIAGNVRFIGATLLHTLASATVGISFALAFYRSRKTRRVYLAGGLVVAIILHTLFNYLLLEKGGDASIAVFLGVWIGVAMVLLFFERLKTPSRDYC